VWVCECSWRWACTIGRLRRAAPELDSDWGALRSPLQPVDEIKRSRTIVLAVVVPSASTSLPTSWDWEAQRGDVARHPQRHFPTTSAHNQESKRGPQIALERRTLSLVCRLPLCRSCRRTPLSTGATASMTVPSFSTTILDLLALLVVLGEAAPELKPGGLVHHHRPVGVR
jgi:hypothetical protein